MKGSLSTFTCSKLAIETLEQGKTLDFTPCSSVCIVNFEHVNTDWGKSSIVKLMVSVENDGSLWYRPCY